MGLKYQYDDFKITGVEVTDDIFNCSEYIDLPKQYVKDMNLTDMFGVLFKKENCKFGKLEKKIYDDAYIICLGNTIIESKEPVGVIKGHITNARIGNNGNLTSLNINYVNDHHHSGNINFHFNKKGETDNIAIFKHDNSKAGVILEHYFFDEQKNAFCESKYLTKNPKCITEKGYQEYMDLANYFLMLMKNNETKELWEETKKQRELNKQNSLEIKLD